MTERDRELSRRQIALLQSTLTDYDKRTAGDSTRLVRDKIRELQVEATKVEWE